MCQIIQIPDLEPTPYAEHDTWSRSRVDVMDDYRRRTINVLASEIEELVAANVQAQFDAHRPAKWKV